MCLCPSVVPEKLRSYHFTELKCGSCPECLRERANSWVLRCVSEARTRRACGEGVCMVTLTYDQYLRDDRGNILYDKKGNPLELPPDRKKLCQKRDVQLFMKRLRSHFPAQDIKYLATAEHGKRTNRAHYHALLFGVSFDDLYPYKKSDRGNQIFRSKTLERLWKNGICTVDSVNVYGSMARYVTKYSMKDRGVSDTFQLFSHGIGETYLFENFTGRPYMIEGREYSIPRFVWNRYIMQKYGDSFPITSRYVNRSHPDYDKFMEARHLFSAVRNSDPVYTEYLLRQQARALNFRLTRPSIEARVAALDPVKEFRYRNSWYRHHHFEGHHLDVNASPQKIENYRARIYDRFGWRDSHLPLKSRQYTANDRIFFRPWKMTEDDEKKCNQFFETVLTS